MRWTDGLQLLLTLLLAAACLLPLAGNFPQYRRDRQFWMPAAALLYGGMAALWTDKAASLLVSLFEGLARWFPTLLKFPLALCLSYLTCILFLLLYLPFKLLVRYPLGWVAAKSPSLYEWTAGHFYEPAEGGSAFLRKEKEPLRGFFRALFAGAVTAAVLTFALSVRYPYWAVFRYPVFPLLPVFVLAEIVNFLNGVPAAGEGGNISGEGAWAQAEGNFLPLRQVYRILFPGRFLCDGVQKQENGPPPSPLPYIAALCSSEDPEQRALGLYFRSLSETGFALEEGRIRSVLELLKGNSVLYATPFYPDISPYLGIAFCRTLVRGGKVLVLAGRPENCGELARWLQETLDSASSVPSLWKAGRFGEGGLDAAVLSSADLYNQKLLDRESGFLAQTSFLFLPEPSRLAATGQIGLRLLRRRCAPGLIHAACDRNQDGLLDTLSHLLGASMTEVVSTEAPAGTTVSMYWAADGRQTRRQENGRVLGNVARYLGFGTELAAVAMKNQVAEIRWVASERVPLLDLEWLLGQYHPAICGYAGLPSSQQSVQDTLAFQPSLWDCPKTKQLFAIIEDETNNLFEASRQFATRASSRAFLHVLSGQYLLRDYMCSNRQMLATDPKVFPSIAADYADTRRNTAICLLIQLENSPMREDVLCRCLDRESALPDGTPAERLWALLASYFPMERYPDAIACEQRRQLADDESHLRTYSYYHLNSKLFQAEVISLLKNAYYITEKQGCEAEPLGSRLLCHVYQSFLPGQRFTFSGKYYEIRSISPAHGVLLQRAADHFHQRTSYRQLRSYRVSGFCAEEGMGTARRISGIGVTRGTADLTVSTSGYLELSAYQDLQKARQVLVEGIPERHYRRKSLLRLDFPKMGAEERLTVTMLLQELFRTAFPDTCDFLAAVTDTAALSAPPPEGFLYRLEGGEPDAIYLIEDSLTDLGLTVSVERSLMRFLEQMTDYLLWHQAQYPAGNQESASAAGQPSAHPDGEDYLRFGGEGYPDGVQPEQTLQYLLDLGFGNNPLREAREWSPSDEPDGFSGSGRRCDFCGTPLSSAEFDLLPDGRARCTACRRSAIDSLEEFQQLYQETRRQMETWFGIHLESGIPVKMISAAAMARLCGRRPIHAGGFCAKPVGLVLRKHGQPILYVENGAPRMDMVQTLVHELTHIWQYRNWEPGMLRQNIRAGADIYEGMAIWAELQFLYILQETARANRYAHACLARDDEDRRGLTQYQAQYPFAEPGLLPANTPFQHGSNPFPLIQEREQKGEVQ